MAVAALRLLLRSLCSTALRSRRLLSLFFSSEPFLFPQNSLLPQDSAPSQGPNTIPHTLEGQAQRFTDLYKKCGDSQGQHPPCFLSPHLCGSEQDREMAANAEGRAHYFLSLQAFLPQPGVVLENLSWPAIWPLI